MPGADPLDSSVPDVHLLAGHSGRAVRLAGPAADGDGDSAEGAYSKIGTQSTILASSPSWTAIRAPPTMLAPAYSPSLETA